MQIPNQKSQQSGRKINYFNKKATYPVNKDGQENTLLSALLLLGFEAMTQLHPLMERGVWRNQGVKSHLKSAIMVKSKT